MVHLGDICKINGAEIEPVWVVTGGSPCQDLSIAGKRAGLVGARSGNAVCPPVASELVRANLPEWCGVTITTMAQLMDCVAV